MNLFRCFKFITGLLPPPFVDTRRKLLRYWFLPGDTDYIAPFNIISFSSSLTSLDCPWFKTGGLGNFPCTGFSRKGVSNLWTIYSQLEIIAKLDLLETGSFHMDALCLHWSTEVITQGHFVWWCYFWMIKFYLGILETVADIYLVLLLSWFPCMLWVIFGWHHLDILHPPPRLPLFCWIPSRGPPGKGCCLFVIAEKSSWDFCLFFAVLMISDSNLSPKKQMSFLNKNLVFFFKEFFSFSWDLQ